MSFSKRGKGLQLAKCLNFVCPSSGAPESPVAPAGRSPCVGCEEVVRAPRRLFDGPPHRPPGFPRAASHALVTWRLRWPYRSVSTSSCFASIQLLPRPKGSAARPPASPATLLLQDASLAPDPGLSGLPASSPWRALPPGLLTAGSSWAFGPPSHARHPPRESVSSMIRPPRDGSVPGASPGVGCRAARSADHVDQDA